MISDTSENASADLPLGSCIQWLQKQTSRRRKAQWAIRDFAKFKTMLDDLSILITELKEITASIADIRRQREYFVEGLSQCTDTEDLQIIEEALSTEDSALSYAASERRAALTEAAMTIQSFPFSNGTQNSDDNDQDEMKTQADSDPDVQSSLMNNDSAAGAAISTSSEDGEKHLDISVMYGHQNNLSDIQKEDLNAVHQFTTKTSKTGNNTVPPTSLKHSAKRLMYELRYWQSTAAAETPFISIGFEENRGESEHSMVRDIP